MAVLSSVFSMYWQSIFELFDVNLMLTMVFLQGGGYERPGAVCDGAHVGRLRRLRAGDAGARSVCFRRRQGAQGHRARSGHVVADLVFACAAVQRRPVVVSAGRSG